MACTNPSEQQLYIRENFLKLKRLYNGESIIDIDGKTRYVGKTIKEKYGDISESFSENMFREIVYKSTAKPFSEEYLKFTDADFRRIANEIGKEAKALQSKNINWFERLFFVKRGTMNKYTVTRWMNKEINNQINYERSKYSNYVKLNTDVSAYLRKEIVERGAQSKIRPDIKVTKDLEKLERELESILSNPKSESSVREAQKKREEILDLLQSDGGKVLSEFIEYMETDYISDKKKIKYKVDENGNRTRFSTNIEQAGELSRALLNDMGGVLINGLQYNKQVMRLAFLNTMNPSPEIRLTRTGKRVRKFEEKMDELIADIQKGIKDGNYFPHIMMEGMQNIEKVMSRIEAERNVVGLKNNMDTYMGEIGDIMSRMRDGMYQTPQQAKNRSKKQYDTWMQNPLAAMRKYSLDALAFNKHNKIKTIYMRGMKRLPKDMDTSKALKDYVDDMFTLQAHGYQNRPDWINKSVRALTGYEFLSKIGFGVATAARNMGSGFYYLQGLGNRAFLKYTKEWNKNREVVEIIKKVEEEAGFRFEDVAQEYALEGLLPTRGSNISDMDIKLDNKNQPYFAYKDSKGWRAFDSSLSYATNKGAVFQKVTENVLRKHMFRSSFLTKWMELKEAGMSNRQEMTSLSKRFALDMVNKYAFEYAASQKAPVTGGTTKGLGAVGQVAAQFFHFPFSFLQLQSNILRNSKDAIIARQWDNPEARIPLKFAGLYLFTHMLSGLANLDFHRLIENDTVDRIKNLKAVIDGEEDVKGRGYLGPAVGDLFFLATMYDFIELEDNELSNLIVGYNNAYSLTDEQKQQRLFSTLNVELSKQIYRGYPALQSGTGWNWLMHEFGLYPRAWTSELHKQMGFEKPKKKKGRKTRARKGETELDRLYRAMGI